MDMARVLREVRLMRFEEVDLYPLPRTFYLINLVSIRSFYGYQVKKL